jgi:hypothetical protein
VPGGGGAVSVRCGTLVATLLRLGGVSVRRGTAIVQGQRLGVAGSVGVVRLGARRRADRFGYVDPLTLLGGPDRPRPVLGRRRVGPPPAPRRVVPPRPSFARRVVAPRAAPARAGLAAWAGAGLLAVALAAGVTRRAARWRVASATACPSTSPRPSTT